LSLTAKRIRPTNSIIERIGGAVLAVGDEPRQALELPGVTERDLHLGGGLLSGDDFVDPPCG
jgi:hypothetical protein